MLRYSLRLAGRTLVRRARRFTLLALLIALGTAGLVAVLNLATTVEEQLEAQAKGLLGADVEISWSDPLTATDELALAQLTEQGARVQQLFTVPILATANEQQALAQLRLVDPEQYPFYGSLALEPTGALTDLLTPEGAVLEASLAAQLEVQIGDTVQLGERQVTVTGLVHGDPTGALGNPLFGPPLFVDQAQWGDLPGAKHVTLIAAPAPVDLSAFAPEQVRAYAEVSEGLGRGVETVRLALSLVAFVALALAAVGISASISAFLAESSEEIAIYKALGFSGAQVAALFSTQIAWVAVLGSLLGGGLGLLLEVALIQVVSQGWAFSLPPVTFSLRPFGLALAVGLAASLLAALPALAQLTEIKPLQVLRPAGPSRRRPLSRLAGLVAVVGFAGFAAWLTGSGLVAFGLLQGLGGLALLLLGLSWLLFQLLARLRFRWLAWRFARRSLPATPMASTALAIGTFLLAGLTLLQGSLLSSLRADTGTLVPNLYLLNVPAAQRAEVRGWLAENPSVEEIASPFALLTAAVQGQAAALVMESDGQSTEAILAGRWFTEADWGHPLALLRDTEAAAWGYGPGDELTLTVGATQQTFTLIGIWEPEGAGLRFDAPLIVAPGSLALPGLSYVLPVRTTPEAGATLQKALLADFPGLLPVTLADVTETVAGVLRQASTILQYVTLLALLTGGVSIASAVASAAFEKRRDAALLKAIGASRRELIAKQLTENTTQGLVAGLTGASLALLLLAVLQGLVSGSPPGASAILQTLGLWPLVSAGLAGLAGLLAIVGILNQSPLEILRSEN